jgi:hypothetical protein
MVTFSRESELIVLSSLFIVVFFTRVLPAVFRHAGYSSIRCWVIVSTEVILPEEIEKFWKIAILYLRPARGLIMGDKFPEPYDKITEC